MRPARIIAALVFALLTLLAAPAWAAPATVQVSPSSVAAGDTVTLSGSVGPDSAGSECAGGVTLLSTAFVHTHDFAGVPAVFAAVRPDGTFTATTEIPRAKAAGTYTITGRCGGGNLGVSATLVVRAAASPTTTPAPAPPAVTAPPVTQPQVPAVAGPSTQPATPATPATAHPASSRWLLPGLAALSAGLLAALSIWLLYRHRHPAGLDRRPRSRAAR
jgi:hypothetical protein